MPYLKNLLFAVLLQFVAIQVIACHCEPYVPDFFKNVLRTDLVCMAVCEGTGQDFEYDGLVAETGFFRILDRMTIDSQEKGDTILVTGQDGLNCGELLSRFTPGDTVFLALGKGFYYEFARDTFYLEGACGKYYLEVEEGISNGLNIQQINDRIYYLKELEKEGAWQMFHPYRELLYEGESQYRGVLGLWVDSMALDESAHYIFNDNIQMDENQACNTPYGPSWLGRKVSIGPNGEHTFFNMNGDSILLLSQAKPGESWLCYEGVDFHVEAMVVDNDTMSFLGVVDSVKTIGFKVFDLDGTQVDHALDQMSLLISKTHGAIRVLNFKLFPDISEFAYGYFEDEVGMYELIGMSDPILGLQNFGWQQIFGFAVGDEFHILDSWRSIYSWSEHESFQEVKTILKVIEAEYSEMEFSYRMERKELIYKKEEGKGSYEFIHDTIDQIHEPDPVLSLMPGEPYIRDGGWAYSLFMLGGDVPSKTVPSTAVISGSPADSCWGPIMFDGCFKDRTYFVGLGGPFGSCSGGLDGWSEGKTELVYYSKSWGSWGTPFVLTGRQEDTSPVQLRVYPNPAKDHLMIESAGSLTEIQIVDLSGRILLREKALGQEMYIDLAGFQSGIYMIGIKIGGTHRWEKVILQ